MAEATASGVAEDGTGDGDGPPGGAWSRRLGAPAFPLGRLAGRRFEQRPTRLLTSGPPSLGALAALPGVARVTTTAEAGWTTTLYDTTALALLRAGVVLGHRCGGPEPGWHLALPAGPRHQVVVPPGSRAAAESCPDGGVGGTCVRSRTVGVPAPLRALTRSRDRGVQLRAMVRLRTIRRQHRLLSADGGVLAEVAADWVSGWHLASTPVASGEPGTAPDEPGTAPGEPGAAVADVSLGSWHVVAVRHTAEGEPAAGALGEVVDVLAAAAGGRDPSWETGDARGARGENGRSGDRAPNGHPGLQGARLAGLVRAATVGATGEGGADTRGVPGTAGHEALAYCHRHVSALVAQDPLVRLDVDDAVHRARVATRRLRSALATFRPLFDRSVTDPLREELRWLAGELATARDAEVQRDQLAPLVAALPGDLVPAEVAAGAASRVRRELQARYQVGLTRAVAALDSDRYLALLAELARLVAEPPLNTRAARGDGELRRLVARSVGRLEEQAAVAQAATGPEARQLAEHELRKAAKRVRYASETTAAAAGRPARRLATRAEAVQEALGGRQDAAVTRQVLRELALAPGTPPDHAFAYGVLAGRLHERAAEAGAERELHGLRLAADRWPG